MYHVSYALNHTFKSDPQNYHHYFYWVICFSEIYISKLRNYLLVGSLCESLNQSWKCMKRRNYLSHFFFICCYCVCTDQFFLCLLLWKSKLMICSGYNIFLCIILLGVESGLIIYLSIWSYFLVFSSVIMQNYFTIIAWFGVAVLKYEMEYYVVKYCNFRYTRGGNLVHNLLTNWREVSRLENLHELDIC